jgi:hypothetical protein
MPRILVQENVLAQVWLCWILREGVIFFYRIRNREKDSESFSSEDHQVIFAALTLVYEPLSFLASAG